METDHRATFRMPEDVQRFLASAARTNRTSQNAEFIRAVRERMLREQAPDKAAFEDVGTPPKV